MRPCLIAAAALLAASSVLAASTKVHVEGRTYYVDTGTQEGKCHTQDGARGGREIVCVDGQNMASVSTSTGCLESSGKGYCAEGLPRPSELAGAQLNCVSGASYFLLVGSEATCKMNGKTKTCQGAESSTSASADCEAGCGNTSGAGGCCKAGTSGCPPPPTEPPSN